MSGENRLIVGDVTISNVKGEALKVALNKLNTKAATTDCCENCGGRKKK